MAQSYRSPADRCPYDIVPPTMLACPRYAPMVAFDRVDDAISTCAHARCSIVRSADGGPGAFYLRCALRTGEIEAERDYVVPLD